MGLPRLSKGDLRAYYLGLLVCIGGFLFGYDTGVVGELCCYLNHAGSTRAPALPGEMAVSDDFDLTFDATRRHHHSLVIPAFIPLRQR